MDSSFLKIQTERCRSIAELADQFAKKRLLNLAEKYERSLGLPSRATRAVQLPERIQPDLRK